MAMKPGMEAIMMPRKLMRLNTEPWAWALPAAEEPITGMYLSPHSFASADTKATARVRLVVPVVPEAETTRTPAAWVLAMEVPPVPTAGIFLRAAAATALLLTPLGSLLISTRPSMAPSSISFASCSSSAAACWLISLRAAASPHTTCPPSRV